MLEKTLESPLDCKEIQPVHPKGDQSWVFIGRTDVEAETPILWPPDMKNWLFWKVPDAGKDWRQEEKRTTEDEMVGWHHWLNGYEFESSPGVGDGQEGLVCCSPCDRKESDMTEQLNWADWTFYKLLPCFGKMWLISAEQCPSLMCRQLSASGFLMSWCLAVCAVLNGVPPKFILNWILRMWPF